MAFSWSFILFCSLSSRTHLLLINVISVFPLSLISPSTAPFNRSYCAHSGCSMKILPSEKAFRLPSFSDWNVLICSFHFYISMSSPIQSDTLRCSSFKILFFFFLKSQLRKKKRLFILPLGKWACSKCYMQSTGYRMLTICARTGSQ